MIFLQEKYVQFFKVNTGHFVETLQKFYKKIMKILSLFGLAQKSFIR